MVKRHCDLVPMASPGGQWGVGAEDSEPCIKRETSCGSSPAEDLLLLAAAAAVLLQLLDGEWVVSSSAGPGWGLMWMMGGGWGGGGAGADIQECRRRIMGEE